MQLPNPKIPDKMSVNVIIQHSYDKILSLISSEVAISHAAKRRTKI